MKAFLTELAQFGMVLITTLSMIYIEVIIYWVVLFKEFLCNC